MTEKIEFSWRRAIFAEGFGAFLLTFADGAVGIVNAASSNNYGVLARVLPSVAVIAAMIFCIGEVSGAHLNPVVTLAFWFRRVFPGRRVWSYVASQITGALLAGILLRILFGASIEFATTDPHGSVLLTFVSETLLTWFLLTAILSSAQRSHIKGWEAAFPVAATLLFCGLVGKEISGASMNPARSFGTSFISGNIGYTWIYFLAPLLGALLGVVTVYFLRGKATPKELKAAQGEYAAIAS